MIRLPGIEQKHNKPEIPVAPMIDIVLVALIFYMTLSIFYQLESEIAINVPEAKESQETQRNPGEIIINVMKNGEVIVNQKALDPKALRSMLQRMASLYPNQSVIIRADKKTYHEHVVGVLDACAAANIWNIAFSTVKDE